MTFVLDSAGKKTKSVTDEADEYIARSLKACEKEESRNAVQRLSKIREEIMLEISAGASKTREEYRRTVLLERERLLGELENGVKEKLTAFKQSERYDEFLLNSAAAFKGEKGTLYLSPDDSGKKALFEKDFDDIQEDNTVKYGGLRFKSDKCFYDDTLDVRLSAALSDFRARHKELCL